MAEAVVFPNDVSDGNGAGFCHASVNNNEHQEFGGAEIFKRLA